MLAALAANLLLLLAVLPPACVFVLLARRAGLGSLESLLAAAVLTPIALLVETVLLAKLPVSRPLDVLHWVHAAFSLACIAWIVLAATRAAQRPAAATPSGAAPHARRAEIRAWFSRMRAGLRRARRASPWVIRIVLPVTLALHLITIPLAVLLPAVEIDELTYHLPQAIQIIQDRALGRVYEAAVWADSYPRAVPMLGAFAYLVARSDSVFHTLNAPFLALLCLASACAARRLGASRAHAILASCLTSATPIAWFLSTTALIDLPVCALVSAACAFALPRPAGLSGRAPAWLVRDAVLMLSALVLALWMKFTVVGPAAILIAWRCAHPLLARAVTPRHAIRALACAPAAVAVAAIPYLQTALFYPSPIWPVRLAFGPVVLFDGTLDPATLAATATPWPARLVEFFLDFTPIPTPESPGSLGPVFALMIVPASLLMLVGVLVRSLPSVWTLPAALFVFVLLAPQMHMPRYAMFAALPGAAFIAVVLTRVRRPEWDRAACVLAALGIALGGAIFLSGARARITTLLALAPAQPGDAPTGLCATLRSGRDESVRISPDHPHPRTIAAVRAAALSKSGLVWSGVPVPTTLLHSPRYPYRVEYHAISDPVEHPATAQPRAAARGAAHFGADARTPTHFGAPARGWLDAAVRTGVTVLVLPTDSPEAELAAGDGDWTLFYDQPRSHGTVPVRVFVRSGRAP